MKLPDDDAKAIRDFARMSGGASKQRLAAVAVYWRYISEHCNGDRNKCPEMEFMSEILSPCPDYAYRATLRKRVIAGEKE